jgi:hypothetical protein
MLTEGYFRFTEARRGGTRRACPPRNLKSEKISAKIAACRNFCVELAPEQGERCMNREFQEYGRHDDYLFLPVRTFRTLSTS